ncbi:MAG: flagellar motor switch protein FliM [Thermodesulfobacteriota bacterium]|nr:flagellar motor switch protein FliM [Thermodesulfobacteriota bacterium]
MNQILSQEEVNALLEGVTSGEVEVGDKASSQESKEADKEAELYNFRDQEQRIMGKLGSLSNIQEKFAQNFKNSLTIDLRKAITVENYPIKTAKFREFLKSLPVPISLNIFKMKPLPGSAILVIDIKLAYCLIDVFFGGKGEGETKVEGRHFSLIEQKVIKRVVNMGLLDIERAWEDIIPLSCKFIGSDVSPQLIHILRDDDIVVVSRFLMEIEDVKGDIMLCIPYSAIEPVQDKIKMREGYETEQTLVSPDIKRRLNDFLLNVPLNVQVKLGRSEIKMEELIDLKPGDIIQLDRNSQKDLVATIESRPKLKGLPGSIGDKKAIKITKILKGD